MKIIFFLSFLLVLFVPLVYAQEWEFLNSGVTNDLNGISCVNELTCYAVGGAPIIGGPGVVIKTTNGGDTWQTETIPTTEPLRAIKCVDETCYAVGDGIILRKTFTTPWTLVDRSGQTLWDVDATGSYAVAVGNLGTKLRTTNGVDWSGYLPPRIGTFEPTLLGIKFVGESGWSVGYDGVLKYTNNGGETWTNLNSGQSLTLSNIFVLGNTIWTCGSFTHISKSIDSGSSWTNYDIPSIGGCGAIEFANETLGWIFGNGAILSSKDGGQTWERVRVDRPVFFSDVECFGPDLCYGVGDDGVVVRYGTSTEPEEETTEPGQEEPRQPENETEDQEELREPPALEKPKIPVCPAPFDDCEAGWNPVFEYKNNCPVSHTCVRETEEAKKPSGGFGNIFDGIKSALSKIFSFFTGPQKTEKSKNKNKEDADSTITIFEVRPSERQAFGQVLDRRTTCNPAETRLNFRSIVWGAGTRYPDTTIVAPHGTFDSNTDDLLLKTEARFGSNYVIARDYEDGDLRINVNRPSERFSNGTEIQTIRAARVYNTFKNCVDQFDQKYYIEIHGNSRSNIANEIEVATVNVSSSLARYLKNRFDVHKRGKLDGYSLKIEPLDTIPLDARQNKAIGMLSHCNNICLHFEHPFALREENRDISKTAEVLTALFEDLENYTPPTKILSGS